MGGAESITPLLGQFGQVASMAGQLPQMAGQIPQMMTGMLGDRYCPRRPGRRRAAEEPLAVGATDGAVGAGAIGGGAASVGGGVGAGPRVGRRGQTDRPDGQGDQPEAA